MVGDCKGVAQISGVLDVKVLHTQDLRIEMLEDY